MARQSDMLPLIILGGVAAWFFLGRKPVSATIPRTSVSTGAVPKAGAGSVMPSGRSFIQWYQAALNQTMGCNLELDGIHGALTSACLSRFQAVWGLPQTGNMDSQTEYYLHSALGESSYIEQPFSSSIEY